MSEEPAAWEIIPLILLPLIIFGIIIYFSRKK